MSTPGPKILVVEDEQEIRRFLRVSLDHHGYRLVETASARDAVLQAATQSPDLIILDLGLPDGDGLDVIRQIREWSRTPIIVLSARGQESDKVQALDLGADDYLTKPFAFDELLARLRALTRRGRSRHHSATLACGPLQMDLEGHTVNAEGQPLHLSATEYRLLEFLMRRADTIVSRTQLADHVWGNDYDPFSNVADVYVGYLRRKLTAAGIPGTLIQTIRGLGYMLKTPSA